MTTLELILLVIVALIVIFLLVWFLKGSTGRVSLRRPVESRIDEYLDRRFDQLIEEHSLVLRPQLQNFKREHGEKLGRSGEKVSILLSTGSEMKVTLSELETRLDALEAKLAGSGKKNQ